MNLGQMRLMGVDVIVDSSLDDLPKMAVSRRFAELMPAEFVADLNAWMLEFFGVENRALLLGDRTLVIGAKTLKAMESA